VTCRFFARAQQRPFTGRGAQARSEFEWSVSWPGENARSGATDLYRRTAYVERKIRAMRATARRMDFDRICSLIML